jgi:hypothetical protein
MRAATAAARQRLADLLAPRDAAAAASSVPWSSVPASVQGPAGGPTVDAAAVGEPASLDVVAFGRGVRRAGRAAVRNAFRRQRAGGRLSDDEVAWLGVLLGHLPVRDYAWERVGEEDWQVRLWTDVLRRVEPGQVPPVACLLAFAAWRSGHGALAAVAVERARTQDPDYSMAGLLQEVLQYALPPSTVDDWPMRRRPPRRPIRPARSRKGR